jgi:hypothetical protein
MAILHPLASILGAFHLFLDYLRHHPDKCRVIIRTARADQIHAQIIGDLLCLDIEIVKHFDVVADKANRRDDHWLGAFTG